MTWREGIRELVAAGVLIVSLGAGAVSSGSPVVDVVRVGAFNIQVFGDTKAGNPELMDVLARVAREFDVRLVQGGAGRRPGRGRAVPPPR